MTGDPTSSAINLDALRAGDNRAVRDFVSAHLSLVFNLSMRLCHNRQEAEDLTQDVFVKTFRALPQFKGESKISTWLYRITVNAWKNKHRRDTSHSTSQPISLDGPLIGEPREGTALILPEKTPSVAAVLELKEMTNRIYLALDRLDPDARAVLVLRDISHLDYDEITAALEIPMGTVKSRLAHARESVRGMLAIMGGSGL